MSFRRLLRIDWDVIAGIMAALAAMVFSFMGVVSEAVVRGIVLLLCALLLVRDLRAEAREQRMFEKLDLVKRHVVGLTGAVERTDLRLVGPKKMRQEFAAFAGAIYGQVRWYNACCRMFRRQEVFDVTLRPFLDNPNVTSICLLCRPEERQFWETDLYPKLLRCDQGTKVPTPLWGAVRGNVSFVLGDIDGDGRNEAMIGILDEPFAARNEGPAVPRFLLRVSSECDLIASLEEVARHAMSDFASDTEITSANAAGLVLPVDRQPRR